MTKKEKREITIKTYRIPLSIPAYNPCKECKYGQIKDNEITCKRTHIMVDFKGTCDMFVWADDAFRDV
jgi:hypothetical protein